MIELNKYILLDSSNWIDLLNKKDSILKEEIQFMYEKGVIPLFTYSHLVEILSNKNQTTVDENFLRRISLLDSIPNIATLKYNNNFGDIGDLHCFEAEGVVKHKYTSQNELRAYIQEKITFDSLNVGTSKDAMDQLSLHIDIQKRKTRLLSAINRYGINPYYEIKMSEFENYVMDSRNTDPLTIISKNINTYFTTKRLSPEDSDNITNDFMTMVDSLIQTTPQGMSFFDKMRELCKTTAIDPNKTFGYYMYLFEINKHLELIANDTQIPLTLLKSIPDEQLFSLNLKLKAYDLIQKELAKDARRKIELGNFIDINLLVYSLYFTVIVDKRVIELVKRLNQSLSLKLNVITNEDFKKILAS